MGSVDDKSSRLLFRACPRCAGTLCKEQDTKTFEIVWCCLNCGAVMYGETPRMPASIVLAGSRKKPA